jgi:hypothetical protein
MTDGRTRTHGNSSAPYWYTKDCVVGDGQRLNIIAARMFGGVHNGQKFSLVQAKQLAIAYFYDYQYREWRETQLHPKETT